MIRWASLLGCMTLMGCTFSPDQCLEDTDCPQEQSCMLKGDVLLCVSPSTPETNGGEPDTGVPPPDMSMTGPDFGDQPPCNTTCSADGFEPNEDQHEAKPIVPDRYGCLREVLTEDRPRVQASLCADDIDWFEVPLNPCELKSFILNVDIVPKTACGLDFWDVRGDVWSCESPTVSCISNEEGRRIRFLISSTLPGDFDVRFAVRSFGAEFDYDVRISAEE